MIKVGFHYYAKFAGVMSNGRFKFSITEKDGETPYYTNIFCDNNVVVKDGDKVKIIRIVGSEMRPDKNQKMRHTMSCEVEVTGSKQSQEKPNTAPEPETSPTINDDDFNTGPLLDISSDDLPF